jgi:hypothetical protein
MKKQNTRKPHHKLATPGSKTKRPLWIILLVVLVVAVIGGIFWQNFKSGKETTQATTSAVPNFIPDKSDKDRLVGRWTRTDSQGAYVIEIKSATADGKLEASYFNPKPINIARAEWRPENGKLTIVVELRDVNYPGSTYTLNSFPAEGRMTGIYYQAVEQVNYDVEFVLIQ